MPTHHTHKAIHKPFAIPPFREHKTLTTLEFEALRPKLQRFSPENIQLLQDVLVKAIPINVIIETYGKTHQTVYALINNALLKYYVSKIPDDWLTIQFIVPAEVALQMQEMADKAHQQFISSLH